jgi:hypothetical protein
MRQLESAEQVKQFSRAIRADGTVGFIRAIGCSIDAEDCDRG